MTEKIWTQEGYIKAYDFAARAHRRQKVPGTRLPYISHPTKVCMEVMAALEVETENDGSLAVQCALLHDVIEDTRETYQSIEATFGTNIADGVLALSKNKSLPDSMQMKDSLERIKAQPREVQMVKLADRITNLQPPPSKWNKKKIREYYAEAIEILDELGKASHFLSARLRKKIDTYKQYFW